MFIFAGILAVAVLLTSLVTLSKMRDADGGY